MTAVVKLVTNCFTAESTCDASARAAFTVTSWYMFMSMFTPCVLSRNAPLPRKFHPAKPPHLAEQLHVAHGAVAAFGEVASAVDAIRDAEQDGYGEHQRGVCREPVAGHDGQRQCGGEVERGRPMLSRARAPIFSWATMAAS